jgi:hypothetical protein
MYKTPVQMTKPGLFVVITYCTMLSTFSPTGEYQQLSAYLITPAVRHASCAFGHWSND